MARISSLLKSPTKPIVVKAGNVCRIKQREKLNEKSHCFHELHYLGSLQRSPFGKRDRYGLRRNRASPRSEEHTSELQSLMRISYAVFCLKKKKQKSYNIRI